MKSAGNDIVALRSVDKQRTNQSRFYSKILSASEQVRYHEPQFAEISFENYVWLLWSVKESTYKYLKRIIPDLIFSPTNITVEHIDVPVNYLITKSGCPQWESVDNDEKFYEGKVTYESSIIYFRSKISEEWIATVVNNVENFENVYWGIRSINNECYEHQSKEAKIFLLNKLNSFFRGSLQVEKSHVGYPVILEDMRNTPIAASLAHDGHFVAYSFILSAVSYLSAN